MSGGSVKRTARQGRDLQRYDGDVRLTAGCVCQRDDGKVLLVSSLKRSDEWTLPKGGWDNNESVEVCATREAEEEGGVIGVIHSHIGAYDVQNPKSGNKSRLAMFLLKVDRVLTDEEWAESHLRKRCWVTVTEARTMIQRYGQRESLSFLDSTESSQV
eukprot:CFRG5455T1